jgi:ubiquinol-cytochrome c reductase cytochrome b subunit
MMGAALLILFALPWLDGSPVRSMRFRPIAKWAFLLWTVNFMVLGWVGGKPAEQPYILIAKITTAYYFAYFLVILPLLAKFERPLPLPESIARAVLPPSRGGGPLPAGATAKPMEKA